MMKNEKKGGCGCGTSRPADKGKMAEDKGQAQQGTTSKMGK